MQHMTKVDEIFGTYNCNMCAKHIQHPDKTVENYNTKTLHKTKTAAIFRTYSCNIGVKHVQH
jgi:hypothetical protein